MRKPSFALQLATQSLLILITAATLYPVLWVLKLAFNEGQAFSLSLSLMPRHPSLQNFYDIFSRVDARGHLLFWHQLANSLIVSLSTTVIGVGLACSAAYAFSRLKFPGRSAGLVGFLVTQMFPGVLMMIPLYVIMDRLHLLDSLGGLVLVYSTGSIPFCVWMLKGYFDTIPKELEEAALIDGATRLQIFLRVILPLSRPAIAVTALFSFMTAWNEFILSATFMASETSYTLPVMLQHFVGAHDTEWGHFAAGALIVSLPVVILFFALQRNLVGGLTAGGVKG